MEPQESVSDRLRQWLTSLDAVFTVCEHAPTYTSEQSAAARGESLSVGGKALVVKVDEAFRLFVLPADRKLASGKVKKHFSAKALRFASKEELFQKTGLVPGSVPPFGHPILDLELFVDVGVSEKPRIAFNAGSLVTSFVMETNTYLRVAAPSGMFAFAA